MTYKLVRRFRILSILVLATVAGFALMGGDPIVRSARAQENVVPALYLPLAQRTGEATKTPTPPPPPPPPPPDGQPKAGAFFADTQWRTTSAAIAADAQGGLHLAYTYYQGLADGVPNAAVYLYCAKDCAKPAQWKGIHIGEEVNEIQLALTPQGRPRLLYRTRKSNNGFNFYFAACNENCTDPTRWNAALVASNEGTAPLELNDGELPQRYFALDNAGRPRFVYNDRAPGHYGTFYTYCDDQCLNPNNWGEVRINKDNNGNGPYRDEDYFYPSLTFSPNGQPRIALDGVTMQDEFFLFYVACDANCNQRESWQSVPLFPRGAGFEFSYDIEINSEGDPRIAYYEAAHVGGGGNELWYAWCNDGCLQSANWSRSKLGLKVLEGQEPDLELDGAGRPHIAYALFNGGGLGYSTCTSACESAGAQWKHQVVENRTKLETDWPVAHPLICSGGLWDGLTPSLSLDAGGAAHIAYDATYYARCHYEDKTKQWEPWHEMNLVWRAVRVHVSEPGKSPVTATPTTAPKTPTATETTTTTPTPTETVTPTETPVPPARRGTGLFQDTAWRTSSSDLAVDGNEGMHVVYVHTEVMYGPDPDGNQNPTSAVYRTCKGACDSMQNWSSVTLGEGVSEAQIGVTPQGKPRLLLLVRAQQGGKAADRYIYGECNQNCTTSGGWQLTPIVTVPNDLSWRWIDNPNDLEMGAREYEPRRYFALDPTGRPRFVYYHYNSEADPNGVGAYYAACEQNCTQAGSWSHTRITEVTDWSGMLEWEILENPTLTFAPDGSPRILAEVLPLGILRFTGLYYVACDGSCENEMNWYKVMVGNSDDASGEWDLAVDSSGRNHILLSQWWQQGFRYGWCNADCFDGLNWQFVQASISGAEALEVEMPDLEVDSQGRPRVAFKSSDYDETGNHALNSLFYLWCNAQCRSVNGEWRAVRVESSPNLRAEWTGSIPAACSEGTWYRLPLSLVLSPTGAPRVAGDVQYVAPCEYNGGMWEPGEQYTYSTVWRAARVVRFDQP